MLLESRDAELKPTLTGPDNCAQNEILEKISLQTEKEQMGKKRGRKR
jgi:hypothetical protein